MKRKFADHNPVVPFVESCSDGTYMVHDEAAEYLSSIDGPLGVVVIIGKYRTGKSTLLNRCLLQKQVLTVGSTVNACTKGILLVKQTLEGPVGPDGKTPIPVVVLDTEGLGSIDATSTHDTRIFSMALLLSSLFIYNSVGSIDETALSNLSLVANICKTMQLDSQDGDSESFDKAEQLGKEAFPPLLWIVRDFALQLVSPQGHQIDPSQYLEQTLQSQAPSDSSNPHAQEKNDLRKYIKACFPMRHCITMVRPVTDELQLQSLSTSIKVPVRKMFAEQMDYVRRFVLHNVRPKRIGGEAATDVTGSGLVAYARAIVDMINKGAHPVIHDAWTIIKETQCRDALDAAKRLFESKSRDILDSVSFEDIESECIKLFKRTPMPSGQTQQKYFKELKQYLATERTRYEAIASRVAQSAFSDLVCEMGAYITDTILTDDSPSASEVSKALQEFRASMTDSLEQLTAAPLSVESLGSFTKRLHKQMQTWVLSLASETAARGTNVLELQKKCSELELAQSNHESIAPEVLEKLRADNDELLHRAMEAETSLADVTSQLEAEQMTCAEAVSALQDAKSKIDELHTRLETAKNDYSVASRESASSCEDKVREAERAAQAKYVQQLEAVRKEVDANMSAARKEFDTQIRDATKRAESATSSALQQEAVRTQLQTLIGELRSDLMHLNDTRLSEQLDYARKVAEAEKALVATQLRLERLQECHDPALPQKLRDLEHEYSAAQSESKFKAHEIHRLEMELSEAKAAASRWQTKYYDERCKFQEELLVSKFAGSETKSSRMPPPRKRAFVFGDDEDASEESLFGGKNL